MTSSPATKKPFLRRRSTIIGALVVGLPALALAWWLFSPLFLNRTVVEEFPRAAAAQIPAGSSAQEVEAEMLAAEGETTTADDAMPEADPVKLRAGQFMGADSFHRGSGEVGVYQLGDGSRILRLEDIDITNGPDLHVILSPVAMAGNRADVMASGYVDLGALKGNRGSQNYDIPAAVAIGDGDWTVVVYCQPFHVIFATATLAPGS